MTIYVAAYTAILFCSGAMAYRAGDDRDKMTWAAIAVAAVLSHYSLTFGVKSAVALHAVAYLFMAVASFQLSTRMHGDMIGLVFSITSAIGFLSIGGFIPYQTGQGLAWNFWNLHAVCFYAANIALITGVWRRYNAF